MISDDPRYDLVPIPVTGPSGPLTIRLHAAWSRDNHAAETILDLATRLRAFSHDRYRIRP